MILFEVITEGIIALTYEMDNSACRYLEDCKSFKSLE